MIALKDSKKIPSEQYIEIRYEKLTKNPEQTLEKILSFIGLNFTENFKNHFNTFSIKNMNYKYKENFSENEMHIIETEINDLLHSLNYK